MTDVAELLRELDVVELGQPITSEMAGWRGSERADVRIEEVPIAHSVPGARISATHLAMVLHAGTHVDAARHFFPDGSAIDDYDTRRLVCRGVALDVRRDGPVEVTAADLAARDPGIGPGDAVLLSFGYAGRYTQEDYHVHPYLSADAAAYLADREIGVLGVDLLTPDCPAPLRPSPFSYPVHGRLLRDDVLIVENLGPGIEQLVGREFLFVMPVFRIPGSDASPVAPVALVPRRP